MLAGAIQHFGHEYEALFGMVNAQASATDDIDLTLASAIEHNLSKERIVDDSDDSDEDEEESEGEEVDDSEEGGRP